MNAPTRTVRRLDRLPGEPAEEKKTVAGIVIEKAVPIPTPAGHKTPAIHALLALEVGESFVYTGSIRSAIGSKPVKATERRFTARRIGSNKFRVWRIE